MSTPKCEIKDLMLSRIGHALIPVFLAKARISEIPVAKVLQLRKRCPQASAERQEEECITKESEYGVQGIKAPLIEVAVNAEEVWGPR